MPIPPQPGHDMKTRAVITLAFVSGIVVAPAAGPSGWSTNLTATLAIAATNQQPVLAYFTASWCGPCKLMARTTFMDETVTHALAGIQAVTLDIDEQQELAAQHNVRAVPTFVMFSPSTAEVGRATGYRDAEQFIEWLTNSVKEVALATARQKQYDEKLADVARLLRETDTNSLRAVAVVVFDLCAEDDASTRKAALALLDQLAEKNPSLLPDGLNHPRLATRIVVANFLRGRIGDTFDIDPWSDADTRRKAAADWTNRLTSIPTSESNP